MESKAARAQCRTPLRCFSNDEDLRIVVQALSGLLRPLRFGRVEAAGKASAGAARCRKDFSIDMLDDSTEPKTPGQAFGGTEAKLRFVLNNVNDLIYALSIEPATGEWKLDFLGDRVFELTGYRPEDFVSSGGPAEGEGLRGQETILVVEDDDDILMYVQEALEDWGYSVLAAPDGPTACTLAAGHDGAIDLVLTDIVMPGMSGVEVARRLASARPGIRIVYTSGYTQGTTLPLGTEDKPGPAFLEKPFSKLDLGRTIRDVLDQPAQS